jgi:hypothetical protein
MATVVHYMKQKDLLPQLQAQLTNGGVPVDLTTASSIKFMMSNAIVGVVVNAAAAVTGAPTGLVAYTWISGDTDLTGTFQGEFAVTWPSGKEQTFPNDSYLTIKILAEIA